MCLEPPGLPVNDQVDLPLGTSSEFISAACLVAKSLGFGAQQA